MERRDELSRARAVRRRMFFALALWAVASWSIGLALVMSGPSDRSASAAPQAAIAVQCVIWGALNGVVALLGLRQARRADRSDITPAAIERELRDRDRLARVLQFSERLSLALAAVSLLVLVPGIVFRSGAAIGHGGAMLSQMTFLYLFERVFLARLTSSRPISRADNAKTAIDAFGSGR